MRTRVKFCGFTRPQDVQVAIDAGVDALGFVFYGQSPRYIEPSIAAELIKSVPTFVSTVGLFVNASLDEIKFALNKARVQTVQLHGDETWDFATQLQHSLQCPVIKAIRVNTNTDWAEVIAHVDTVAGVLLDADSVGYGGSGSSFDWKAIPTDVRGKIILSGGLQEAEVMNAIRHVAPYALDVSSGIELGIKGEKDSDKMNAFMQAVRLADAKLIGHFAR